MLTGVTFNRTTDNSYLSLCGSTDWDNGAAITLNGKDRTDNNGFVKIRAKDGSHVTELVLKPDGTATWGGTAISLVGHTHTKANITDFPTIPSKTSQLTNDSGFLTAHQSLSNYSTLANTVKSISISGKTITVTPGSGSAYTLTTQDTVYTHPTTAGNKHIPSGGSANQYLKYSESGTAVWANLPTIPSKTSQLTNDSGFLTSHQSLSNYSTLANTIKSLSISGRTITYTKGDNSTGTLTTQDNNTWTAMVGATSSANGSVGYVNAVPPKDGYNTKYLRADGTWQVPPDHTYTVNNATLTIQKNGTTVKTFTANASSNVTCNITVPTKTSELTNNSGFLTSHQSLSGYVKAARTDDKSEIVLCGGTNYNTGAALVLRGQNESKYPGNFDLHAYKAGVGGAGLVGNYDGSLYWGGQLIQSPSDQRLKQQISNIDDKLLDAWEDVLPCQFKYNSAVDQKGDTARLHTGYVVQQINEACKSHNLDISAYGLYCHEEYPERTEEVTITNEDGTTSKETKVIEPAKEQYSLRYTEALIVECAYLRREVKRLSERLEKLEK